MREKRRRTSSTYSCSRNLLPDGLGMRSDGPVLLPLVAISDRMVEFKKTHIFFLINLLLFQGGRKTPSSEERSEKGLGPEYRDPRRTWKDKDPKRASPSSDYDKSRLMSAVSPDWKKINRRRQRYHVLIIWL